MKWYACLLFFLCTYFSKGQSYTLQVRSKPILKYDTSYIFSDTLQRKLAIEKILNIHHAHGYLAATIDSSIIINQQQYIYIGVGKQYKLAKIQFPDTVIIPQNLRGELELGQDKIYATATLKNIFEKLLSYYENSGFPFASLTMKPTAMNDTLIEAQLSIDLYKPFYFDTIDFGGSQIISKNFIYQYLGIKPGSLYNEQAILDIEKRLNELPFLEATRPPVVYFKEDRAYTVIYINARKASSFDGLLGLAPANEFTGDKLLLTGEAHLRLLNLLNRGYHLELDYKSFRGSSQDLQIKTIIPYLFKTQVGSDVSFSILKFDTSYIDIQYDLGLRFQLKGNKYIKAYFKHQTVSLLTIDTQAIKVSRHLPAFNDLSALNYGLAARYIQLDYIRNPRRGWQLFMDASAGRKNILPITGIKELGLYNDITLKSIQYRALVQADAFIPIKKNSTVHIGIHSAWYSASTIFYNELYRIGGIKTLKGFDEQSIFASSFAIANMEYRYLFALNSYAVLFANGAWWEQRSLNGFKTDTPFGFGGGLNFETGAGIFSIYYALGKQFNNPILLKNGKVHFGITSYF
jgi:outer membrane protein assembly factor BamA